MCVSVQSNLFRLGWAAPPSLTHPQNPTFPHLPFAVNTISTFKPQNQFDFVSQHLIISTYYNSHLRLQTISHGISRLDLKFFHVVPIVFVFVFFPVITLTHRQPVSQPASQPATHKHTVAHCNLIQDS